MKTTEKTVNCNLNGINNVTFRCKGTIAWEEIFEQMIRSYINNNKIIEE